MKRLQIQLTAVLAVCLSAGLLSAQAPRAAAPLTPAAAAGCTQTTGGSLRTLPEPLLDELERMSGSVFVQAFLLNFVATTGDTNNWLTKCALAFIRTPLDSAALVQGQVSVTTIIRELRATDSASKATHDIRQREAATLRTIARQLLDEPTLARFEGAADFYRRANQRLCVNARSAYCAALITVVAWYDSVSVRHQRMDSVYSLAETAERAAGRASEALAAIARGRSLDSTQLQQARDVQADTSLAKGAIEGRAAGADSLRTLVEKLRGEQGDLVEAGARFELSLDSATTRLESWLRNFSGTQPIDAVNELRVRDVDEVERGRSARAVSFSAEPPQRMSEPAAAAPANVLMAFTDFVIDRAKQDLVLAYIADIYSWIRKETLLQVAFPETYELMRSIMSDTTARGLSEVAIGRLSLATWQATFVSDFRAMPINLLAASPSIICGKFAATPYTVDLASMQKGAAKDANATAATSPRVPLSACESNVLAMQPLSKAARRVLGGEPAFSVLRDLHNIAQTTWGQQSTELRRLTQGLAIIHALADAYYLQGNVENPDPLRHPYVVSLEA